MKRPKMHFSYLFLRIQKNKKNILTDLGFFCILTFVGWSKSPDDIIKFRGVAQVVERYFREVEAASSSLVTPT